MNGDIEERLQALRPCEPAADLLKRLLESEPPAPGKIRRLRRLAPLAAAAAAAALLALPLMRAGHSPKPPSIVASGPPPSDFHVFVPIEQTSTLLDVRNVAVIDVDPSHAIRLISATWLDDITYAGDDGHSRLRRHEPRMEILSVPLDSF